MGPRKQANYIRDLLGWAEFAGVEISPDARDLVKTDARPALRAAMVAGELGRFREFHHPAYAARWCDAQDLSQRDVLASLFELVLAFQQRGELAVGVGVVWMFC